MIFATALIVTAAALMAAGQTVSAPDSRVTAPASNGVAHAGSNANSQDLCEQRLLKTLDALDKAEKALGQALNEIEARKNLDALKDQLIGVKDLIISEYQKLVEVKDKKIARSKWKAFLAILEKAAMIAAGILIGRGL